MNEFLEINNLEISLKNKKIIDKLKLKINSGETHVIMGPNGAGKSTLAKVISGDTKELDVKGEILFEKKNILNITPDEIALKGIFLSFQHPIEINGVSNLDFFKSFINNKRKKFNLEPIDREILVKKIKKISKILNMNDDLLHRSVNYGFSGGEKKRNEILQMILLEPKLAILDEIDSGLDIDSLKSVFNCIEKFTDKDKSLLLITHYNKILKYITPDFVHILIDGKIKKTGDKNIINYIEKHGYKIIK